ncbi:Uncharacterised protein [Mycobacteroides abscessus subsp. bolletii]|uniref:hypothetical protein n=1 Tax=Mycobacteroides abscessus TaxID=36809 RepID=UPI00092C4B87|nr:hypothetical protein [Mycobacteroides abscessus]SHY88827.1 Uncharacterised protein [Mycobacteroides abscessus subsp. bolletii]SHZ09020.1 Uncharacterised protein [Mycobacteroides abscessus subsp. bolletii]
MVRSLKWAALPVSLTVLLVVLMAIRIPKVQGRASIWTGDGCKSGPYDPSEHTYLLAITAVTAFLLLTLVVQIVLAKAQKLRVLLATLLIPVLLFASGYLFFVWTGGESNNHPGFVSDCHFG